jgi:hypothetical protein
MLRIRRRIVCPPGRGEVVGLKGVPGVRVEGGGRSDGVDGSGEKLGVGVCAGSSVIEVWGVERLEFGVMRRGSMVTLASLDCWEALLLLVLVAHGRMHHPDPRHGHHRRLLLLLLSPALKGWLLSPSSRTVHGLLLKPELMLDGCRRRRKMLREDGDGRGKWVVVRTVPGGTTEGRLRGGMSRGAVVGGVRMVVLVLCLLLLEGGEPSRRSGRGDVVIGGGGGSAGAV